MGFICPLCRKDFGLDQKRFKEHLANSALCSAASTSVITMLQKKMDEVTTDESAETK